MSPDFPALISRCTHPRQLHQIQAHLTAAGLLVSSVFLHNTLIRAHARTPFPHSSLALYAQLLRSGLLPDTHTFPFLLKACSLIPARPQGLSAHAHALKLGLDSHLFVNNALIHFYSVVGAIADARRLLDHARDVDVVSYNSMISGYVRTGDLGRARRLFDGTPARNVVTWSAMISGYAQGGCSKEALGLFSRMQAEGFKPDDTTLVSVLAACAHLGALEQGKWVHGYLRSNGIKISVFLGTSLIDMYAKCGKVELGLEVFNGMQEKNLLAWTTIITGLAMHGRGLKALKLFSEMEKCGVVPDDIAFIGALCACMHAGLVNEGCKIFDSMSRHYGIRPKIEHYGCMVDLLARNGLLHEARHFVESMPMEPDALIWGALMAGCRFHRSVELAEHVVKHLIQLEPDSSGVYVLLANIYAASGRHDDARKVRFLMKKKGVQKTPGCSLIEIGGTVHQFLVGDTTHPQIKDILMKWEEIENRLRLEGYVPDKKEVLLDIDEEDKEDALARHSEKLAIAFGLISTVDGMAIRVLKNLRVCGDCHHVIKLISKVYDREIVVRDRTRFHLFKGGSCSCKDYW
ncbi:pentatricopeptide repeat-containing protein At5g66520-like [Phoenix dactylifera]|uniref:Pentatricopeptide repeat-containing protein At5g66520-like n=1 Tax=Phoenix dactylifera TaxID=42345 RepID=A0A8B7CPZ6_PHODC|nr:pentatricopeptide repeat-containing protein At5g66520-like [Phoenix dactylifera]